MTRGYFIIVGLKRKIEAIAPISSSAYPSYYGAIIADAIHDGKTDELIRDLMEDYDVEDAPDHARPVKDYVGAEDYAYVYDPKKDVLKCYENGKLLFEGCPKSDYEYVSFVMKNFHAVSEAILWDRDTNQLKPYNITAIKKQLDLWNLSLLKLVIHETPDIVWTVEKPYFTDGDSYSTVVKEVCILGRPAKTGDEEPFHSENLLRIKIRRYEKFGEFGLYPAFRVSGVDSFEREIPCDSNRLFLRYCKGYRPRIKNSVTEKDVVSAIGQFATEFSEEFKLLMTANDRLRKAHTMLLRASSVEEITALDKKLKADIAGIFGSIAQKPQAFLKEFLSINFVYFKGWDADKEKMTKLANEKEK